MKRNKGFTLVEVIVVVALVAAVSVIMYAFFGQGLKLYTFESDSFDKQTNLREVMSDITNNARLTAPAQISCGTGTLTVGSYTYAINGSKITRNGSVIASGISSFTVSINSNMLGITVVNTAGTSLSTSLSLLG